MHDPGMRTSYAGSPAGAPDDLLAERLRSAPDVTRIGLSWLGVSSIGVPRPRAIMFGAETVLTRPRGQILLDELAADGLDTTGITCADIVRALMLANQTRRMPSPSLLDGSEKVAVTMLHLLGLEHPAAALACLRGLMRKDLYSDLDAEAIPALTAVRDAGIRLCLVSDSTGVVHDHLATLGLLRLFDVVVDSGAASFDDPHPHRLSMALRKMGVPAEACWYVGDGLYNDVLDARAAGYGYSVLLDRFNTFTAVPDIVRIRRLAELTDLLDRTDRIDQTDRIGPTDQTDRIGPTGSGPTDQAQQIARTRSDPASRRFIS